MLQSGSHESGEPNRELTRTSALERSNSWIAERLRQAASLLAAQGANPFRVAAYRRAGVAIEALDADVRSVAEAGGHTALEAIPGIGPSIAGAVAEMLSTGRWGFLERLKGAADPEALFCSVPGIGPSLAHKIQETLQLNSLEALETAAHDGRLRTVPGFGARRIAMVRSALTQLLARIRPPATRIADEPEVRLLLDVDRETGRGRQAARCARSRQSASIQAARPGCLSCIRCADLGTSPHFIPIRRLRIGSGARATGLSCTSIGTPGQRAGVLCYRNTRPGAGSPCRAWTRSRMPNVVRQFAEFWGVRPVG